MVRHLQRAQLVSVNDSGRCVISAGAGEGTLADELPDSLFQLMSNRVDVLSATEQACIKVASVVGARFRKHVLRSLLPKAFTRAELDVARLAALARPESRRGKRKSGRRPRHLECSHALVIVFFMVLTDGLGAVRGALSQLITASNRKT